MKYEVLSIKPTHSHYSIVMLKETPGWFGRFIFRRKERNVEYVGAAYSWWIMPDLVRISVLSSKAEMLKRIVKTEEVKLFLEREGITSTSSPHP